MDAGGSAQRARTDAGEKVAYRPAPGPSGLPGFQGPDFQDRGDQVDGVERLADIDGARRLYFVLGRIAADENDRKVSPDRPALRRHGVALQLGQADIGDEEIEG